ncbi:MAG: DRTGG domain-containing protein [Chloroflexi bacterium]|nr:DRTGG domain-containing protein [Chloroflexota bacterium]
MPIVYIAGDAPGVGVTAAATGLASHLGGVVTLAKAASFRSPDPDAAFHRALLPHASAPASWPVSLESADDVARSVTQFAGAPVADGLVIVEGVSGADSASDSLRADVAIADALNARVVLVSSPASAQPARAAEAYGDRLAGVIINHVPVHGTHTARAETSTAFEEQGVPVLGLVPEDRRMLAPTVRNVAEHLGAHCINHGDLEDPDVALDALVEHFMLGGLFLDTGVYVFGRREEKAVIVRGDRPDLQMAALETSTVCLVLTEGRLPVQYIVHHADLNQVPMLLVGRPTLETMEALHNVGERATVHSAHKARRFGQLLSAHCDLSQLTAASAA